MEELLVVDVEHCRPWTFTNKEKAQNDLERAKTQNLESIETWQRHCKNYPDTDMFKTYLEQEQKVRFEIMTYDNFLSIERQKLLSDPLQEIEKERFEEMLDVLPPLYWCTHNGVEMFCISEMYTGSYTNQYAHDKTVDKYYTKMVDSKDRSTWICELLRGE